MAIGYTWNDIYSFGGLVKVKNPPAMQETWDWFLSQEDSLGKEMATHSSILPGESHGERSLVGYSPRGHKELDTTEWLHFHQVDEP